MRKNVTNLLQTVAAVIAVSLAFSGAARSQSWQPLNNQPGFRASTALLLTDGTVMVQDYGQSDWWRLTPDASGSYINGSWSQLASLPAGYAPLYYSSAVLADGRVIVIGGEYNFFRIAYLNTGAIYDPVANAWSYLSPPYGWRGVADAQNVVLPDGKFLLASFSDTQMARLDPATLAWTPVSSNAKADRNDQEGWTLLPDGTILTVDTLNAPYAEKYLPKLGTWVSAGSTVAPLAETSVDEVGPAVLRPDGTVFGTGVSGETSIYHPALHSHAPGVWTPGPVFPDVSGEGQLAISDGPAALLPNGNVLVTAGAGQTPVHFFEFDGTSLTEVPATPNAQTDIVYNGRMLVLPTGQVLYTDGSSDVEIYTSPDSPDNSWKPAIQSAPFLVRPGSAYRISGTQFNGLSQASIYGDDATAATNYPEVRTSNPSTGSVIYARTHGHCTMGVATGDRPVSTHFDLPAGIQPGLNQIVVVANGIASDPSPVFVLGQEVPLLGKFEWAAKNATVQSDGSLEVAFKLTSANGTAVNDALAGLVVLQDSSAGCSQAVPFKAANGGNPEGVFSFDPISQQYVYELDTTTLKKGKYILQVDLIDGSQYEEHVSI